MARIHQLAMMSVENTNLSELANILLEAVQAVIDANPNKLIHEHPAIRLICYNIAFAGDGDIPVHEYYRDVMEYCKDNAEFETEQGVAPSAQTRIAS